MKLFDRSRRNLNLLSVSLFVWGLGESLFIIFQPLYLQQLGADSFQIGAILSASLLVMSVIQVPVGLIADRYGRRNLMYASWILGFVAALIMGLAQNLTVFIVGLLLYGLTGGVVGVMNGYVSNARGDWSVGRAVTFVSASFNAGALIGPFIGGLLAERFGLNVIYLIAAGIFFVSMVIVFFIREQPVVARHEVPSTRSLLANRRFLVTVLMIGLVMFGTYLPIPLTANFLQNERAVSLASIGIFGSIASFSGILVNLFLGQLNPMLVFLICQLGMVAAAALFARGSSVIWYGLAYFLAAGIRLFGPMGVAMVKPMVHEGQIGLAFGILDTGRTLAMMLAPLAAGWLYGINPPLVYTVAIVLGLLLAWLFNWYYRARYLPNLQPTVTE
jgi:DHA1 family multidrug resistance protein-like MFS transporter